ncbi:Na+/H+ antiporter NhaC family protein [Aquibacillus kalidii]|uniref:Na+/H+ antiporter NhaC family protein n=1 Tax=Aquibacillus kalidii TaxID=2762597 RepID=UPI001646C1CF|nr:Na+/H+ antiporter NhaC family protein [Aquibacillus kalidii]
MENSFYSLLPAVLMLILVLVTRKVLLSLGLGVLVGAILLHDFNLWLAAKEVGAVFLAIFIDENELNIGNIYLLSFLLLLGIITAFLSASGGSRAFGEWAIQKVQTRKGAQLLPIFLGIIIFIDDYFNSLAVGQVARPVTDRHKISRAKLAYFIDSTSAPITVISPISSWGAYIIGTIGAILAAEGITDYQPLEAFVRMIPMNLYAFAAILLVIIVAVFDFNIGSMKKHEDRAIKTGDLFDPEKGNIPGDLKDSIEVNANGKIHHLMIPIFTLIISTILAMIITGIREIKGNVTILAIFENTNVNLSLFIGGLLAVVIALFLFIIQRDQKATSFTVILEGIKAMLPAIYILILAWMIGSIIDSLGTGTFLAQLVNDTALNASYLPLLFFVVASFMALATGTSWGTFGIMLPIAGEVAAITDVELVLPALAAVLAGSVFGDHCSPISDTSILSSTGAGSNHIDHVVTQLPYAFIGAIASAVGYVVMGVSHHVVLSFATAIVVTIAIVLLLRVINKK